MSEYTLTACVNCAKGYRLRDMHEVYDMVRDEDAWLCEECYGGYVRDDQEPERP